MPRAFIRCIKSEARAVTNLIGKGIAAITAARWEKAFDEQQAIAVLNGAEAKP